MEVAKDLKEPKGARQNAISDLATRLYDELPQFASDSNPGDAVYAKVKSLFDEIGEDKKHAQLREDLTLAIIQKLVPVAMDTGTPLIQSLLFGRAGANPTADLKMDQIRDMSEIGNGLLMAQEMEPNNKELQALQGAYNHVTAKAPSDWKAGLSAVAIAFAFILAPVALVPLGPIAALAGIAITATFVIGLGAAKSFSRIVSLGATIFRGIPTAESKTKTIGLMKSIITNLPDTPTSPVIAAALVASVEKSLTGVSKFEIKQAALDALKVNKKIQKGSEMNEKIRKGIDSVTPNFAARIVNAFLGTNVGGRRASKFGLGR